MDKIALKNGQSSLPCGYLEIRILAEKIFPRFKVHIFVNILERGTI